MTQLTSMCELACQIVQTNLEGKQLEEAQAVKAQSWKLPVCYDDDDDEEGYYSLNDNIISELPPYSAVTHSEPVDSLSMGDEHLNTIPTTESDEFIKSCVENLVPNPSESKGENGCDVLAGFTTFSNVLFNDDYDSDSSDDQSLSVEDEVSMIYSKSLFDDEENISPKIDLHYFNAESNLFESLLNRDTFIDSSPMFDYLLEEFSGELAHNDPIPSGIVEADFDLKEEIRLVKNLSYDNSSPRPSERLLSVLIIWKDPVSEFSTVLNAEITDTIVKYFSPYHIPVEDSDSQMEEIDLFLDTNDLMSSGSENDDYDSKGDMHFLEELLSNDPFPLFENESYNFDHHYNPSFPRPPLEPPDVEIFFDFEPDTGVLTAKIVEDISKHYVLMPKVLPTLPTLYLCIDTLLPFSFENEDKVFKPGILSYFLVSHRDKITFNFSENSMMMYGGDIPHLDVPFLHFYPP
nr:hypothetical protein [Tanacetum cinerariifolium]